MFLNDDACLPAAFASIQATRSKPALLYIGQASKSLYRRVWLEECLHRSPGTFFRSVGVMLGYVSPTGGKNFRFDSMAQAAVTEWIKTSLSVSWITEIEVSVLDEIERSLIVEYTPLLNSTHNPQQLALLRELRARSKRGLAA